MEPEVTLMEVLQAREARASRQQALLEEYRLPVVSFTLNIAGPVKNGPVIRRAFREGLARLEDTRFVIYSPTRFKRDIVASRYAPSIQRALHELFSADFDVVVLTEGELEGYQGQKQSSFLPGTEEYTFERFVVGSSNKFAHAAARAVADNPGQSYNPLFIYGESGLGKTHLLYAIAHTIHDNHPDYKVVYIKGDTFTNELIQAIREGRNQEFREKYRGADVFLMDDVQFIAGRDSTQEEMFHTFNTLYELRKQIVFTSDRNAS